MKTYAKILILAPEPFLVMRQARNGLWLALRLFLVVGLVASLGRLAVAGETLQRSTLSEKVLALSGQVQDLTRQLSPLASRLFGEAIQDTAAKIEQFSQALAAVEPPLGVRASRLVRLVGEWLAGPLELLATWLSFLLPLLLVARFLAPPGARGGLRQQLSLSLLAFAPQVLTFMDYLPLADGSPYRAMGNILSAVALVWSAAILVQAYAIANDLPTRQSFVLLAKAALIVYILIPLALGICAATLLGLVLGAIF